MNINGGEAGIRTLGGDKPSTVFKTAAFDHSATSPDPGIYNSARSGSITDYRWIFPVRVACYYPHYHEITDNILK